MNDLDKLLPIALHNLLGRYWKERLQRAVRDATKPPKRTRRLSPEQRERRRQQVMKFNEDRKRLMEDPCLTADDLHDALSMLRAGKSAEEIHEYLGGGLGWWKQWYKEREHWRD